MLNSSLRETDVPLKIGITGGIGSGKSLICSLFRLLGIAVFEADKQAKEITSSDPGVKANLIKLMGDSVYSPGGVLNRQLLASVIFRNPGMLLEVNGIVHPLVKEAFDTWVLLCKGPYVLMEAAILFESGFHQFMDANILVTAPESLRFERVMKRDGLPREEVMLRMKNQSDPDELEKLAEIIIRNDGKELVIPQILEIDKRLRENGKFC
jgi:dephospho-CoA kinase